MKTEKKRSAACMAAVKESLRQNAGMLCNFILTALAACLLQNAAAVDLIGRITSGLAAGSGKKVLPAVGVFAGAWLLAALLNKRAALTKTRLTQRISMDVERDFIGIYGKIRYRDYYFEPDTVLGTIRGNGIKSVESWCELVFGAIFTGASFCVSAVYLSSVSWPAIVLCLGLTGLFLAVIRRDNAKLADALDTFNAYGEALYERQWEQIRNHRIAGFLDQERVTAPYRRTLKAFLRDLKDIKKIGNSSALFSMFGTDLVLLCCGALCGVLCAGGRLSLGGALALLLSVPNVSGTLFAVPQLLQTGKQCMGGMRLMDEIYEKEKTQPAPRKLLADTRMGLHPTHPERRLSEEKRGCGGHMTAECLTFRYRGKEETVLDGFSLCLTPGVHLLEGPSGCGKSTFLRIAAGELPVQGGALIFGEQRITGNDVWDFSECVEYMAQEPVILRAAFRDNVLMGKPMEESRYRQALEKAGVWPLLMGQPEKDATMADPEKLSSGEKQKLALARVFYQQKPVWVLDEPVSALDPAAAERIWESLREYAENRIILVSSHQRPEIPGIERRRMA